MKILVELSESADAASVSKTVDPNSLAGASALIKASLRNPIETANDMLESGISVAATRLRAWAQRRIDAGVVGPELAVCQKMLANPLGVTQQLAHSMVRAKLEETQKRVPNPDVLLDKWFEASMSSFLSESSNDEDDGPFALPKIRTLEEFMLSRDREASVKEGSMFAFMQRGQTYLTREGETKAGSYKTLTIATLRADDRKDNRDFNSNMQSTGNLRRFLDLVIKQAAARGYQAVTIENVQNHFLPNVLTRYGWTRVNARPNQRYTNWAWFLG